MSEPVLLGAGLGAIVGAILALTGAGGGILAIPLLVFGLGLSMTQAAPVGLLAVGLAAALGAVLGLREGVVRYRAAGFVAGIGVLLAPLGLWLAHRVPNAPLSLAFAAVLVYAMQRMFRQARRELRHGVPPLRTEVLPCVINPQRGRLRWTLPCARALALTGMLAGLLSGLLGVGGGFVIVPALTRYTDLDMKSIVATSLAVIALVSAGSVAAATLTGAMSWTLAAPFAGGAVLGLLLGRQFAERLAGPRLQQVFALVGLFAAAMLVLRALGLPR
ncbi:sulfite exporter TauE/SafE family protein [Algiphilus sp. W345]|uniref:Probable membrane transporter protein n=1 Tax=Banduia mediterranea TaxID=3075609 RepID=A0ABU2WIC1_9GAMM|nr:sulfite exporter TauE/SafE family protein [Algiphilus sp. W345]MDT0497278.1 sulfite exporter TauE/SafE family protein [Algiphilus sp. W345]